GITVRMRVEWVSESAWNPHINNGFHFSDVPSDENYDIETDLTSINQLEEWVASGAKEIFAGGGLVEAYREFQEELAEEQGEGDQ
uniref:hypothetical protein n=3 Tax=Pseudomonas aeruginosa TaxID=287 RepID=UPI0015BD2C02